MPRGVGVRVSLDVRMGNETMVVTWVRIPPFPKLYGIGATTSIFNRTHERGSEAVVKK